MSKKTLRQQSGMYLILMALLVIVFLGIGALAIGMGQVAFNKTLQQNIANLAALAALEKFVDVDPKSAESRYVDKTDAALARAQEVLNSNKLKGSFGDLGASFGMQGEPLENGEITFGVWYERPTVGAPCSAPCFSPNPPPSEAKPDALVNAVKITSKSGSIEVPFGKMFGTPQTQIETSALAIIAPRCIAMLLDASASIAVDTHRIATKIDPPGLVNPPPPAELMSNMFVVTEPQNAALMSMRQSEVDGNCTTITNLDELHWCNMETARNLSSTVDPTKHYRSDYQVRSVSPRLGFGSVLVDTFLATRDGYYGPQPYTSVFNAFNSGLRLLSEQASTGDQVMMLVFSGSEVDRLPRPTGLTDELDLLIQMTNLDNIGRKNLASGTALTTTAEITPNAVYEGWIPLIGDSDSEDGTNLVFAIQAAINELSDPSVCPETAKKIIIMATDGIATCSADPNNVVNCNSSGSPNFSYYQRYVESRAALLSTILNKLKEERISFSVMMAGSASRPNFINRLNPDYVDNGNPDDPTYFLNFEQAIARGYGGALQPSDKQFFDGTNFVKGEPTGDSEKAYNGATSGVELSIFGDPNGVLGELAFQTGGVFCPLLATGDRSRYTDSGDPPVLKRQYRETNKAQTEAIEYRPLGEAAALCVLKAVGSDPYALRYEY